MMEISEKVRKYLEKKRESFELEQFLPQKKDEPFGFIPRGYAFTGEYVSGEKKDHENLQILEKW
ncbi:MAG: hypothetical protein LBT01_03290 [Spirochaetaceae bacterium]|jgi:hypothetical protein|nr:hypothetical protein [Spirochaetaceae bacterium]